MTGFRFFFLVVASLLINKVYARPTYQLAISFNKHSCKIGEPMIMSVKINGTGIESVVWDQVAQLFAQNPRLEIIGFKSYAGVQGQFQRDFIFTSIKPGTVLLGKMPIIIKSSNSVDTIFTTASSINFIGERLPSGISDIRPIHQNRPPYRIYLLVVLAGVTIAASIIWGALFWRERAKKRKAPIEKTRRVYLQKIKELQAQLSDDPKKEHEITEQIFGVFKEYLVKTAERSMIVNGRASFEQMIPDNSVDENLNEIWDRADKIRFSYRFNKLALTTYINEIEAYITTYPVFLP